MTGGSAGAVTDVQAVAAEAFAVLGTGHQIEPFSSRLSHFDLDDAYRVTAAVRQLREARGETPVGRKIGFTNRTIWDEYQVDAPMWGYVYDDWGRHLSTFGIDLQRDGVVVDQDRASNVLGGPLSALKHLVDVLAGDPVNPPLAAGEIVTTGTLTRAFPVAPDQTWSTELTGLALENMVIRLA
jgi:2-keto-4-pentenoate hydratase